jgi:eukaryotic-like serine/threonine-protein kinase
MTPDRWQQIDTLLDLALEQEPSRRASFLAEACNSDEALRREVEALLAAHGQAGSFLASPALEVAAKGIVEAEAPSLAGQVIGPYQILSVLGKGGMGEVYLAQDSRLGRKIALKLLPGQFTQDRDRLRRFEREARAASALNHPNILTIHEIGEQGGNIFIATEFIEGQTLRQEMAGGALPLREVLDVAVQVASALRAAHAAGIVHRDIKPENIMLRRDSFVKVLDFGLAKLSERQAVMGQARNATAYWSETETGAVMGTRYLSPEQARELKVDGRTDIFSLGVVMYEMAAGRAPFEGETATDVIIAIVEKEPLPLSQLAQVPAEFEKIVSRALSKNLETRYQTASELESDLKRLRRRLESEDSGLPHALEPPKSIVERIETTVGKVQMQPPSALWVKRLRRHSLLWITLVAPVLVASSFLVIWLRSPLPKPTILRVAQITHEGRPGNDILLTDGARIYFSGFEAGRPRPVSVSVNGGEVIPIPMSLPSASVLDISPQANELLVNSAGALWRSGPLWVLPTVGGTARRLEDLEAQEATWSPDGKRLIYSKGNDLYLAESDGTGSRKLLSMPGHPLFLRWAPEGRRLTVSLENYPQAGQTSLWEFSSDGSNLHLRFPEWNNPPLTNSDSGRWTPDGKYFLFSSDRGGAAGCIWAIRERGGFFEKWSREPVQLTTGPMHTIRPLPSKDGKRVFFLTVYGKVFDQLMRYDSKLTQWTPYLSGISGEQVAFSRDGQWIAFVSFPEANLIKRKVDGGQHQQLQLTSPPVQCSKPRWSPDGKRIAYMAKTPGKPWKLWVASADGGNAQQLVPGDLQEFDPDWSPDGNSLAFSSDVSAPAKPLTPSQIQLLDLLTNQVRTLPNSRDCSYPRWSPDGRYLAATADHCKKVVLFDFKLRHWVELAEGGDFYYPSWPRDGQSVYFINWTKRQSQRGYYRVGIRNHRLERVTDLDTAAPIESGTDGAWVGLAPDDSPIALFSYLGVGHNEIHAIDWDAP